MRTFSCFRVPCYPAHNHQFKYYIFVIVWHDNAYDGSVVTRKWIDMEYHELDGVFDEIWDKNWYGTWNRLCYNDWTRKYDGTRMKSCILSGMSTGMELGWNQGLKLELDLGNK